MASYKKLKNQYRKLAKLNLFLIISFLILATLDACGANITPTPSPTQMLPSPTPTPPPIVSRTFKGHTNIVKSVTFSPDGKVLASGSWDDHIILWDVATGNQIKTITIKEKIGILSLVYSPDGKMLAVSSEEGVTLIDVASGNTVNTFKCTTCTYGTATNVTNLTISVDGTILAGKIDSNIILWNVASGNELQLFSGNAMAFEPDGKIIAIGSTDGTIALIDVNTGSTLKTFPKLDFSVTSLAFSPNGKTLASSNDTNSYIIWDVKTGTQLKTFTNKKYLSGGGINQIAFSPDGNTIVTATTTGNNVIVWDVTTGNELQQLFAAAMGYVDTVAFSSNGQYLACGTSEFMIVVWDTNHFRG